MVPNIKIDLDKIVKDNRSLVVELGSGKKKKHGRITIDKVNVPGVDIVADLEEGLSFLPDESVDEIHCRSVLEHIENFEELMTEIVRVLKNDGAAHIFVPHFSNPYYYSDYTHRRFFGLYTFYYFVRPQHQLRRKVPDYYSGTKIKILSQRLIFRSSFKLINPCRKLFGWFINLHTLFQQYYEENLCYLFPCHGIELIFTPDKQENS